MFSKKSNRYSSEMKRVACAGMLSWCVLVPGTAFAQKVVTFERLEVLKTSESGADEVVLDVNANGMAFTYPGSGYKQMDTGDENLTTWDNIGRFETKGAVNIALIEKDGALDPDDTLGILTIDPSANAAPIFKKANGRHTHTFSEDGGRYTLTYSISDNTSGKNILAIQDFEKSPQVKDVLAMVKRIDYGKAEIVDTKIDGFVDTYDAGGDKVRDGDHIQGITMTPRGRVVATMSRSQNCGILLFSEPHPVGSGDNNNWTARSETYFSKFCVLHKHPSTLQAVGEIVMVASKSSTPAFFLMPSDGHSYRHLSHLDTFFHPSRRGADGAKIAQTSSEAVGITYNAREDRFYAFLTKGGGVTIKDPGATTSIDMYRTPVGRTLLDSGTSFKFWKTYTNVGVSGQGAHLLTQTDGKMYVVSTFSSDMGPDTSSTETEVRDGFLQGLRCASELPFGVAVGDEKIQYHDIVRVTELDPDRTVGKIVHTENIGVSQTQCITHRPSWRYGGSLSPMTDDTAVALGAGRFNLITDIFSDDDFEYSAQKIRLGDQISAKADLSQFPTSGIVTDGTYYWILNGDGTRNYLPKTPSCHAFARKINSQDIVAIPKRHNGTGGYNLPEDQVERACNATNMHEKATIVTDGSYYWLVNADGTRNWMGDTLDASCKAKARRISNAGTLPKRNSNNDDGYLLKGKDLLLACANAN